MAGGESQERSAGVLAVAFLGTLLASCDLATPPTNVLLIVSDTFRADALSCQGGEAETPNLCALAGRGALFEQAMSNASWTLPSSVSLFASRYPSEYLRQRSEPDLPGEDRGAFFYHVGDAETLLAERLWSRGYDVRGFLETELPAQGNALQGFESQPIEWQAEDRAAVEAALGTTLEDPRQQKLIPLLRYLLGDRDRPFFALSWIRDPHAVYHPPDEASAAVFRDASLPERREYYLGLGTRHAPERGLRSLKRVGPELQPAERLAVKRLYLAEIESVDTRVGLLLRALEKGGLRERTLIVFTSDHGEGFGEHGLFLHGRSFYAELVHVPLILAGPGITAGTRVSEPVTHVDLMPTLSELMGLDAPHEAVRGRSLRTLLSGDVPDTQDGEVPEERVHYLVNAAADRGGDAVVQGRYKLLDGMGPLQLFDLEQDPHEERDLADSRPEVVAQLAVELDRFRRENERRRARREARRSTSDLSDVGEETLKQLQAIGYVE